jgi:hypothetical protein
LEYRQVLKILAIFGRSGKVNSRDLAAMLQDQLERRDDREAHDLIRQFSTKSISGDLDRLFRMGFLKRTRVKRMVFPKESLPCIRGY